MLYQCLDIRSVMYTSHIITTWIHKTLIINHVWHCWMTDYSTILSVVSTSEAQTKKSWITVLFSLPIVFGVRNKWAHPLTTHKWSHMLNQQWCHQSVIQWCPPSWLWHLYMLTQQYFATRLAMWTRGGRTRLIFLQLGHQLKFQYLHSGPAQPV